MEKKLGRKLLRTETVHHRDGDKLNNDQKNLELWVTRPPSGARIKDLLKWARTIIKRYG